MPLQTLHKHTLSVAQLIPLFTTLCNTAGKEYCLNEKYIEFTFKHQVLLNSPKMSKLSQQDFQRKWSQMVSKELGDPKNTISESRLQECFKNFDPNCSRNLVN